MTPGSSHQLTRSNRALGPVPGNFRHTYDAVASQRTAADDMAQIATLDQGESAAQDSDKFGH